MKNDGNEMVKLLLLKLQEDLDQCKCQPGKLIPTCAIHRK